MVKQEPDAPALLRAPRHSDTLVGDAPFAGRPAKRLAHCDTGPKTLEDPDHQFVIPKLLEDAGDQFFSQTRPKPARSFKELDCVAQGNHVQAVGFDMPLVAPVANSSARCLLALLTAPSSKGNEARKGSG